MPSSPQEDLDLDTFHWIAVSVSLLLGIGITRLLGSAVGLFRARRSAVFDWMPVAWAAFVFVSQLQLWWSLLELESRDVVWTVGHFLGFVAMTLLLYVAAALVLPPESGSDGHMLRAFDDEGRWAVVAIAAYNGAAAIADWVVWDLPVVSWTSLELVVLVVAPSVFLALRSRPAQRWATAVYGSLLLLIDLDLSPFSYA